MLNLLKDGEVVRQVSPGTRFDLPDGTAIFGAEAGWEWPGGYSLVQAPPPPEPEPPTPEEIRAAMKPLEKWRFETVVDRKGIRELIDTAIAGMPEQARILAYNKRNHVPELYRDDPLFDALSASLGMTPEQVDEMWNEGLAL